MDSFFSKLRQQVSFHQADSDSEEDIYTVVSSARKQDAEADEFIIIEATESQSTVYEVPFSSQRYPDSPPTYRQISQSDELPSYLSVLSGSCTIVSGPTMFSKVELSPLKSEENFPPRNQKSAVSDVPFQLHPFLELQLRTNTIFNELNLEHQSFDWSKYTHDFGNERLCLRDMNSDEMANIDEFLIPSYDDQSYSRLPSRGSEINLIQF